MFNHLSEILVQGFSTRDVASLVDKVVNPSKFLLIYVASWHLDQNIAEVYIHMAARDYP